MCGPWSLCLWSSQHHSYCEGTERSGVQPCFRFVNNCPRFGGAIDDDARYFKDAYDRVLTPYEFVESMKKKGIRVPGIGHGIKRGDNRDKRVELLQLFAQTNFPSVKYMEYAIQVETYALAKQITWSLM